MNVQLIQDYLLVVFVICSCLIGVIWYLAEKGILSSSEMSKWILYACAGLLVPALAWFAMVKLFPD